MKSNSDVQPPKFLNLGDGSWHYNYNIKEVEVENEDGTTRNVYEYDTVQVWEPVAEEQLSRLVIAEHYSLSEELYLINAYNSFVLKFSTDANDKLRYLQYLERVQCLKEMVKQDLISNGFFVKEPEKEVLSYRNFADLDTNAPIEAGEILTKDNQTYKAKITHWKYQVTEANFSTFYDKLNIDENGIRDWVQPTGAHDAYNIGDKVKFEGKTYESVINANVYSPSAYPEGWTEIK